MNKNELEEQVRMLQKENERLDKAVFESEQNLARIQNLIINIVEGNKKDLSKDIEYVCLKLFVEVEEYNNMLMLPFDIERKYRQTGNYPTLQEYHELLIKTLKISEEDIDNFPTEITLNIVEEKVESGDLPVFNKILEEYIKNK